MVSNARFVIAAHLPDPAADLLTFELQRDLDGHDLYPVVVPRQLLEQLGPHEFIEYVADYYFQLQPAEADRVGRPALLYVLRQAL